ncbi:hypothetical protein HPB49_017836 [Dermacentor silvarum]|uniref:Uncharacterized protein n=1 Tax=Dermacentor silvarum TaxID=543639 RepID=A0ACB8CM51_DERSI|nr:hypothetical protein HPB49_017836 [Dermacentor silvarum]
MQVFTEPTTSFPPSSQEPVETTFKAGTAFLPTSLGRFYPRHATAALSLGVLVLRRRALRPASQLQIGVARDSPMDNMEIEIEGEDITTENVTEDNGWKTARSRREPGTRRTPAIWRRNREYARTTQEHQTTSKMPHLPKEDTKIVVRPRGGLNLAKVGGPAVTAAIFHATCIAREERAQDTICMNNHQNIMVMSTPNEASNDKYLQMRQLRINDQLHEVSVY